MRRSGHFSHTDSLCVCVCVCEMQIVDMGNVGQLKKEGVSLTQPQPWCVTHRASVCSFTDVSVAAVEKRVNKSLRAGDYGHSTLHVFSFTKFQIF